MKIEKILASSNRRKIFRILRKTNQTNIMDLVRKAKSTYNQVQYDLRILEEESIIIEERKGRLRMISLNRENPKTDLVLKALKLLNEVQREANTQQHK